VVHTPRIRAGRASCMRFGAQVLSCSLLILYHDLSTRKTLIFGWQYKPLRPLPMGGLRTTLWGLLPDPASAYNVPCRSRLRPGSGWIRILESWHAYPARDCRSFTPGIRAAAATCSLHRHRDWHTRSAVTPRPFGTLDQFMRLRLRGAKRASSTCCVPPTCRASGNLRVGCEPWPVCYGRT
jgi:hypothetical protein